MTECIKIRVVSRETDGSLRVRDYDSIESVMSNYEQVGIDDCSTELTLRGMPVFRGLIGPIAAGRRTALYETADVFEVETRQWAQTRSKRRRGKAEPAAAAAGVFPAIDVALPIDSSFAGL